MIFCVEDDSGIRNLMVYTLNTAGFKAKGLTCGKELFDELGTTKPELIMLDIMLSGDDGLEILKKLRAQKETKDIPVIMATARGTEYDKVMGLDLGADDYLVKPFGMMELVSRIKAVLRRTGQIDSFINNEQKIIQIKNLTLNAAEHNVFVDGTAVLLTLKEYELLKLFMENPGIAFTRDQILTTAWGTKYIGETRTVDVHVGTLRTKLGSCRDLIKTVHGVGYRMEKK